MPDKITENISDQEMTDSAVAHVALTAYADMTLVVDHSGTIRSCFFGQDSALEHEFPTLVGRLWLQSLTRDSHKKAEQWLANASPLRLSRGCEISHLATRSGPNIPIRYYAVRQAAGTVLLIGRDLRTDAHLQNQLLRSQQMIASSDQHRSSAEQRFKVLFQTSPDALLIADNATHRLLEINAAGLVAFDLASNQMVGLTLESIIHDQDLSSMAEALTHAQNGTDNSAVIVHSAIGRIKFSCTATVFRQEDGAAILLRLARVAPEQSGAHATSLHLAGLIEMLPEAFVITDGDGQVMLANRGFLDLSELATSAAAIGQPLERWLGRQGMDFGMMFGVLHEAGRLREVSSWVRGLYGSLTPVEVSGMKLQEGAGTHMGFVLRRQTSSPAPTDSAPVLARSADQTRQLIGSVPLKDIVREAADMIERLCVEAALELSADNRAAAADMLGLSRQSLYAKLHRYGLGDLGNAEADISNTT